MFLLFPQWLGAGHLPGLEDGARRLAAMASGVDWVAIDVSIPVDQAQAFNGQKDIAGREGLLSNLRKALRELKQRSPHKVFTLGGDCSVELAPISFLNRAFEGEMTVVWLDAHADLNSPASSPSKAFHGMPLRHLLGEGDAEVVSLLDGSLLPEQVVLAGVRETDPPEEEFIEALQLATVTVAQMHAAPWAVGDLLMSRGSRRLYIHLDLDVVDPDEFGALGWPVPCGLRIESLLSVLRDLGRRFEIVGAGMTEYLPRGEAELPALERILDGWLGLALL